jgi:hypothetical protein
LVRGLFLLLEDALLLLLCWVRPRGPGRAKQEPPPRTVNDVALLQQQLSEVAAILPANSRDQRNFRSHGAVLYRGAVWGDRRV